MQPVFRIMHLFFTKSSDDTITPVSSLQSPEEIETHRLALEAYESFTPEELKQKEDEE